MYELTPTVVCETAEDVLALARAVEARRRAQRRPPARFVIRLVARKPPEPAPAVRPPVAIVAVPDSTVMASGAEDFPQPTDVPIAAIQAAVSELYRIPLWVLLTKSQRHAIAHPRHMALYLCRKLTTRSMPIIARHFGYTDHTTVLHGYRAVERKMLTDDVLRCDVEYLTRKLRGAA